MTKTEAISQTIYNLENDVYKYNWNSCDTCNCGILARTIMNGKSAGEAGLFSIPFGSGCGFSGTVINGWEICSSTGLPMPEIYKALKDTGFTFEDLKNLESLRNRAVIEKAGLDRFCNYKDKKNVIAYLKAWLQILQEEQQKEEQQEGKTPVPQYEDIRKELALIPEDKPEMDIEIGKTKSVSQVEFS